MSRDAQRRKIYEARVVDDALARLAAQIDRQSLPLSDDELRTLAKRFREAFYSPRKERLARYQAHLARTHGADVIARLSSALEDINNAIGYEEK